MPGPWPSRGAMGAWVQHEVQHEVQGCTGARVQHEVQHEARPRLARFLHGVQHEANRCEGLSGSL